MPQGKQTTAFGGLNCGNDYTDLEREFLVAVDRYKRTHQRPFPTWKEVLALVHALGYRKVEPAGPLPDPYARALVKG